MDEKRYATDQILDMLRNADLGYMEDMNTVSGTLLSFMDGAAQAIYNILHDKAAVTYALNNSLDPGDDPWLRGHNQIIKLFAGLD